MPTFQKCPQKINDLANEILCRFETHKLLLDAKVRIDFVFAYGDRDEDTGALQNDALRKNGVRALAIARKLPLKDRVMGRGDAEVAIDADHWADLGREQQEALLDHELHHLSIKVDKRGLVRDDIGRPIIKLRQHDHEFGWFKIIAERHGFSSVECEQARKMFDEAGQAYFPALQPAD